MGSDVQLPALKLRPYIVRRLDRPRLAEQASRCAAKGNDDAWLGSPPIWSSLETRLPARSRSAQSRLHSRPAAIVMDCKWRLRVRPGRPGLQAQRPSLPRRPVERLDQGERTEPITPLTASKRPSRDAHADLRPRSWNRGRRGLRLVHVCTFGRNGCRSHAFVTLSNAGF